MFGTELILGMALGYIAFTESGHEIGNKIADIAIKGGKAAYNRYIKKSVAEPEEKVQKEGAKDDDH